MKIVRYLKKHKKKSIVLLILSHAFPPNFERTDEVAPALHSTELSVTSRLYPGGEQDDG